MYGYKYTCDILCNSKTRSNLHWQMLKSLKLDSHYFLFLPLCICKYTHAHARCGHILVFLTRFCKLSNGNCHLYLSGVIFTFVHVYLQFCLLNNLLFPLGFLGQQVQFWKNVMLLFTDVAKGFSVEFAEFSFLILHKRGVVYASSSCIVSEIASEYV